MAEILLVDDDRPLLEALTKTLHLRLPEIEIETCSTASLALERILQTDYDVIISDLKMPGLEGLALLGLVRKLRPATPFILITDDPDSALSTKTAGAFQVLSKPIDRDALTSVIRRALQERTPRYQKAGVAPQRSTGTRAAKTKFIPCGK